MNKVDYEYMRSCFKILIYLMKSPVPIYPSKYIFKKYGLDIVEFGRYLRGMCPKCKNEWAKLERTCHLCGYIEKGGK